MTTIPRSATVLAAMLLLACGGSPTAPVDRACTDQTTVHTGESFYRERSEGETVMAGRLAKNCPAASPNGRDHCYFLEGMPVYSGGREALLDRFVGAEVTIVGKRVQLPPFAPEIWAATICRQ